MNRLLDVILSTLILIIFLIPLALITIAIFLYDFKNPFYIPLRVGINNKDFKMVKLRSMKVNADSTAVDSTGNNDSRITPIGKAIRRFKIDEICQFINVINGSMAVVGPRPNVRREVNLYTKKEMKILSIKPGITDFSSIVFADEGEILANKKNPDIAYNQLIRPLKSELNLFYIEKKSKFIDLIIILITIQNFFDRRKALNSITKVLRFLGAPENLIIRASRNKKLKKLPPPGSKKIITHR
jgi:lipopolysaccharide/colanic/teichoic acid biosynthesis glycosyltransferase